MIIKKGDLYIEKKTGIVYIVVDNSDGYKFASYAMNKRLGFAGSSIPEETWITMKRHKQVTQVPLRYVRFDTFANHFDSLEVWTSRRLLEEGGDGNGYK